MTQSGIEATLTTVNCGLIYLYAAFKAYLGIAVLIACPGTGHNCHR